MEQFVSTTGKVLTSQEVIDDASAPPPGDFQTIFSDDFQDNQLNAFWLTLDQTPFPTDPGLSITESGGTLNVTGISATDNSGQGVASADLLPFNTDTRFSVDVDVTTGLGEVAWISEGQEGPGDGFIYFASGVFNRITTIKDGYIDEDIMLVANPTGRVKIIFTATTKVFQFYFDDVLQHTSNPIPAFNPAIFALAAVGGQIGVNVDAKFDNFLYERK